MRKEEVQHAKEEKSKGKKVPRRKILKGMCQVWEEPREAPLLMRTRGVRSEGAGRPLLGGEGVRFRSHPPSAPPLF